MADGEKNKLAKMNDMLQGALAWGKGVKDKGLARAKKDRAERALTGKTAVIAVGVPTSSALFAYLAGRFVAPEHGRMVAGIGAGVTAAFTVAALWVPKYAEWAVLGASAFAAPGLGEIYKAAQAAYVAANEAANEAPVP